MNENIIKFIYHLAFILLGIYSVDHKWGNWFAQLFWGLLGAMVALTHSHYLVEMFI